MIRNHDNYPLLEVLSALDPETLIPVIERGLEITRLESVLNNNDVIAKQIRSSRVLLNFLRARELGLS